MAYHKGRDSHVRTLINSKQRRSHPRYSEEVTLLKWKPKYPPLASVRGYSLHNLPRDIAAALVIAALSIPISMGYAQIAGLPPIYGLYASILPAATYALTSSTRYVVFGMDSAAVAMTGSVIAAMGIEPGSQQVIDVMPLLTIATAMFLLLFGIARVGKLVRYVPAPVMYGFVTGISVVIVVNQVPLLCGIPAAHSGNVFISIQAIIAQFSQANPETVAVAVASLAGLALLKRFAPKLPGALVVLVASIVASAILHLGDAGVAVLGNVPAQMPMPHLPTLLDANWALVLGGALSIAITVTIESLLTLNAFAMQSGEQTHGDRELASFGMANLMSGFMGCPPCSASLSRTAAGASAKATSQLAGLLSAAIIAVFIMVLSPCLYHLPQPTLGAIVVVAMADIVNYKKIRRYAKNIRLELTTLTVVALTVMLAGAIAGVACGIVVSLVEHTYRARRKKHRKLMGFREPADESTSDRPDEPSPKLTAQMDDEPIDMREVVISYLSGFLSFTNIETTVERITEHVKPCTKVVILEISSVTEIDATATDTLRQLRRNLHSQGIEVRIVRRVAPTSDHYTRFELRRAMKKTKTYPTVRAALEDVNSMKRKQLTEIPLTTDDKA